MENNNLEWKYCVVGNIVKIRYDEYGEIWYGTREYTGGTKVYLCGKYWNNEKDRITVIGLNRGNRFQVSEVPINAIDNVRCSKTYKPKVLEIMEDFEFWMLWWDNSVESKKDTERFVKEWNERIIANE